MDFAKRHWLLLTIALIGGYWYYSYAIKSYTNYIALRDAALRTQGSSSYKWTWFPFGQGNPFSY